MHETWHNLVTPDKGESQGQISTFINKQQFITSEFKIKSL